jgi:type IX secretion system PorP/SprF family membrane protein
MRTKKIELLRLFIFIFFTLSFFFSPLLKAQEQALFSYYTAQYQFLNPGYISSDSAIVAIVAHRDFMLNTELATWNETPRFRTQLFSIRTPLEYGSQHGMGLTVYKDESGFVSFTQVKLAYSYRIKFKRNSTLSFGMSADAITNRIYGFDYRVKFENDPFLPRNAITQTKPDISAGIWYKHHKGYFAGIAAMQLARTRFDNLAYTDRRLLNLTAGLKKQISLNWTWKPTAIFYTDLVSRNIVEITTQQSYKNVLNLGLSYRHDNAVSFMIGFQILQDITVGYSYEQSMAKNIQIGQLSHEFMLKYQLPYIPFKKKKSDDRRIELLQSL